MRVAGLGVSPAEVTWKSGVDVMSFGATKNGAMMLEAVVFFDLALAEDFAYRRMRAGQLISKSRYLGAQMVAYLEDGLWLENARRANALAQKLAAGLAQVNAVRIPNPVEANEVFAIIPRKLNDRLLASGAKFYDWMPDSLGNAIGADEIFARFVLSFATPETDVERLRGSGKGLNDKGRPLPGALLLEPTYREIRPPSWLRSPGCPEPFTGNGPGLHGFGDLALERDVKQAVLKVRTSDLDMVGQLEAALEGARGDALVQELGLGFDLLGLLAGNGQGVALGLDGDIGWGEAGDRHGDAVGVLRQALDIVGGIGRGLEGRGFVKHAGETVETDGGTVKGGQVKHGHTLLEQCHFFLPTMTAGRFGSSSGPAEAAAGCSRDRSARPVFKPPPEFSGERRMNATF